MERAEIAERARGLVVADLARRFGRRWAVARVSFDVPRGGRLLITGANGSGKTTLLRTLATALRPHHGRATFDGQDLWSDRARLRGRIALLSHAARLYDDLSATDNLRVWARLGGTPVEPGALLERVGLPVGRPEPVRTYSAGMRRRLALALTLLKKPDLLLLDEPFSALDPEGRELVIRIVREITDTGTTLVVASHLPRVAARLCDQGLHMEAGQIVWAGPAAQAPAGGEA